MIVNLPPCRSLLILSVRLGLGGISFAGTPASRMGLAPCRLSISADVASNQLKQMGVLERFTI